MCCTFVYSVINLIWNKQYVFFIVAKSEFLKHFLWFFYKLKKLFHSIFANFFVIVNVFLGVGTRCSCAGVYPGKESGIQVFGRSPFAKRWDPYWEPPGWLWQPKNRNKVSSVKWKNTVNNFWSNAFGKVQTLTNLPTTTFIPSLSVSMKYDTLLSGETPWELTADTRKL
jgi:hypothetical protein